MLAIKTYTIPRIFRFWDFVHHLVFKQEHRFQELDLFLPQVTGLGGAVLLSWVGQSYSQSLSRLRHFSTISGTERALADPTAWWSCWSGWLKSVQTTKTSMHYFGLNLILLARGNIRDMGITSLIIIRVP